MEDLFGPGVSASGARRAPRRKKARKKKRVARREPVMDYGVTAEDWESAARGAGALLRGASRGAKRGARMTREVYAKAKEKVKRFKREGGYSKGPRVVSVKRKAAYSLEEWKAKNAFEKKHEKEM